MKQKIDGIIVVEGKSDVSFLSSFIDAEFVTTNGSEIPEKTTEYLQKSSGNRDIFVLTDPDSPGKRIRDILDQKIPNLKHCFVSKENSIKKNKVGVAESTKEEILKGLASFVESNESRKGSVTHSELFLIGLEGNADSETKRKHVCEKFHLGHCNAKTFLKRINYARISLEDIKNSIWVSKSTLKKLRVIN